ncbi:hypothetical protein TNCV_1668651 [Trichonephila clavipes]|nr:hypothetical protein TNCV_1668651 [Trichonephila clavipes]
MYYTIKTTHPVYWLVKLTGMPYAPGLNPREGMDVSKCILPLRQGGALNSHRASHKSSRKEGTNTKGVAVSPPLKCKGSPKDDLKTHPANVRSFLNFGILPANCEVVWDNWSNGAFFYAGCKTFNDFGATAMFSMNVQTFQDALSIRYKQSLDNACSFAFSKRNSSTHLIEGETFNDSDIINNLKDYEDSFHAEVVEVEIDMVPPSIVPSGNFSEPNRTAICMVLKANDRRTSSSMPR